MPDVDQGGPPPTFSEPVGRADCLTDRVGDERKHDRLWIPRYLMRSFGPRIGPTGLALYVALAWHRTAEARQRWPSLVQLGLVAGCSRSTVVRTLPVLVRHGLIRIHPCMDPKGQQSHRIILTDPPELRFPLPNDGAPDAGAVKSTAPPCQPDSAPLADCQGGAINLTAPSGYKDPPLEGREGSAARPPTPPAAPTEEESAIARLSAQWLAQLAVAGSGPERAHREEIGPTVAELLRLGWTEEQLRASLDDPERIRFEWPRQWRERLGRPRRVAKRPARLIQTPPSPAGAIPDPPSMAEVLREMTGGLGLAGEFRRRAAETARCPANGLTDRAGQSLPAPPANPPPAAPGE